MTNFLPACFIKERIAEIGEGLDYLLTVLQEADGNHEPGSEHLSEKVSEEVRQVIGNLKLKAAETSEFMQRFPSDPLIYTGEGSTDQVIAMLESLLAEKALRTERARAERASTA